MLPKVKLVRCQKKKNGMNPAYPGSITSNSINKLCLVVEAWPRGLQSLMTYNAVNFPKNLIEYCPFCERPLVGSLFTFPFFADRC